MLTWAYLIAGSIIGGVARYVFAGKTYELLGAGFPYGTMLVNLSGCFLIGMFDSMANEKLLLSPQVRLLLMTGFCGAYTTFSTLILETSNLMRHGEFWLASLNLMGSAALGLLLFRLGIIAARLI